MPANIDPFYAISINLAAAKLEAQGRSVIHMEYGQPAGGAPDKAIAAAHDALDHVPQTYWESPALKLALAKHYRQQYGLDVDPERFVITCGASAAIVLALTANFDAGDMVATARPGYVAYRNAIRALHFSLKEIPCGAESRYQMTAAHIADLPENARGIIIASPANPTGTIITEQGLREIGESCHKRGITVISDETYHGISYTEPAQTMLRYNPEAFVVGSFSKYFGMTGWRLGWLLCPPDKVTLARTYLGNMFLTAPVVSQCAATAAFDDTAALDARVQMCRENRDLMLAALPRLGLTKIAPPDGAFYLYCDVSHLTNDSLSFCKKMLEETGVAMAPGIDFDPVEGRHFIRICFAIATDQIREAITRLEPWFARSAGG